MINPEIVDRSGELVSGWEGCLSVPGMRGLVLRDRTIEVRYLTQHGDLVQQELTGFVARIFQHELDHLDGILFPDRVPNPTELITEAEYLKIAFDWAGLVGGGLSGQQASVGFHSSAWCARPSGNPTSAHPQPNLQLSILN